MELNPSAMYFTQRMFISNMLSGTHELYYLPKASCVKAPCENCTEQQRLQLFNNKQLNPYLHLLCVEILYVTNVDVNIIIARSTQKIKFFRFFFNIKNSLPKGCQSCFCRASFKIESSCLQLGHFLSVKRKQSCIRSEQRKQLTCRQYTRHITVYQTGAGTEIISILTKLISN